jgi:hypothetical protein
MSAIDGSGFDEGWETEVERSPDFSGSFHFLVRYKGKGNPVVVCYRENVSLWTVIAIGYVKGEGIQTATARELEKIRLILPEDDERLLERCRVHLRALWLEAIERDACERLERSASGFLDPDWAALQQLNKSLELPAGTKVIHIPGLVFRGGK